MPPPFPRPFPRLRAADAVRIAAVLLAVSVSALLMVARSDAAFTTRTENAANALRTGGVQLIDNDNTTAMFDVSHMVPGQTERRCIKVTYTGTLPQDKLTPVRVHVASPGTLGPYLVAAVEMGTEGSDAFDRTSNATSCATFGGTVTNLYSDPATMTQSLDLASLVTTHGTYANGMGTAWIPDGDGDARWFRVTFRVKDDNLAQDKVATPEFTWELHSQ
jgi:hypothetical protein